MKIAEVLFHLENWAPASLAESYDNPGLIVGDQNKELIGILVCLDSTEKIINEAIVRKCNLVIAHHPIIFKGQKKINNDGNYVERTIILAIKNDIAIYALHTNLDNLFTGVNQKIAQKIGGLTHQRFLLPKSSANTGAGLVGNLLKPQAVLDFFKTVKTNMDCTVIKHSMLCKESIEKVAVCGGAGSFLIPEAIKSGADVFITADLKYHEYFDADLNIILMDIGHFESEQFTVELIEEFLITVIPLHLIHKTNHKTNPIQIFI